MLDKEHGGYQYYAEKITETKKINGDFKQRISFYINPFGEQAFLVENFGDLTPAPKTQALLDKIEK